MKIGIVSSFQWMFSKHNYGSLFQAYALQSILKKNGHKPFLIKVKCKYNIISFLRYSAKFIICHLLKYLPVRVKSPSLLEEIYNLRNPRYFKEFAKKHIDFSDKFYVKENIANVFPNAEAYIVGSDQMWSTLNDLTFLNFGKSSALRISYAVSRRWEKLPPEWDKFAKEKLSKFNFVSVRESIGVEACKRAGVKNAYWVVDPSALLTKKDYMNLVSDEGEDKKFKRPFVLVYLLNINRDCKFDIGHIEKLFGKQYKIKIVSIQTSELSSIPKKYLCFPTPLQWLNLFDKADIVITNSFHGTMFSLIFQKNFVVLPQKGDTSSENCRFYSILDKVQLTDRIVPHENPDDLAPVLKRKIDWKRTSELLTEFADMSKKLLVGALNIDSHVKTR